MQVPRRVDTQNLLAKDSHNCNHCPPSIGLLTLCQPAVDKLCKSLRQVMRRVLSREGVVSESSFCKRIQAV